MSKFITQHNGRRITAEVTGYDDECRELIKGRTWPDVTITVAGRKGSNVVVKVTYQRKSFEVPFGMGEGHNGKSDKEVGRMALESIAMNECADTFEEFCDACGYDSDSLSALKVFNACVWISEQCERLGINSELLSCELDGVQVNP